MNNATSTQPIQTTDQRKAEIISQLVRHLIAIVWLLAELWGGIQKPPKSPYG